jgi:hypothetical protein
MEAILHPFPGVKNLNLKVLTELPIFFQQAAKRVPGITISGDSAVIYCHRFPETIYFGYIQMIIRVFESIRME